MASNVDAMIVGCHPDDIELGMGATVAAMVKAGRRVVLVDLTSGEPTPKGTPEKRATESATAAAALGVTERIMLGLPNRELQDTLDARRALANIIRKYRPEVLFGHYWEDAHPDHVAGSALTDAARFYAKLSKSDLKGDPFHPRKVIYFLSVHLRVRVQPSFIFDVSEVIDQKMLALEAYQSQFIDHAPNRGVLDRVRAENRYWGTQVGCEYGEPFVCREHVRMQSVESLLNA